MIAIDVSELIEAGLADRHACRLAGISEIHPNTEVAAHVIALVARLKGRIGAAAAVRAAVTFWDSLVAEEGDTTH
jgi:hypothetical protein